MVLLLVTILVIVALTNLKVRKLMGLPEEVIALRGEVGALKARVIADIQKLHDLLSLPDPDVSGALAAIAEIRADIVEIDAAVDIPAPGDTA